MSEQLELTLPEEVKESLQMLFSAPKADSAFVDRLGRQLSDQVEQFTTHQRKIQIPVSPLAWGMVAVILIFALVWGIKTLIPRSVPGINSQPSPSPLVGPTQVKGGEGLISLPSVIGMPVPWPEETITSMNATQVTQLARWGSDPISAVTWAPDGKSFALVSSTTIHIYDSLTFQVIQTIETGSSAYQIAYSPDGTKLAVGSYDAPVKIWDIASGSALQTLEGNQNGNTGLAYSPEGIILGTGTYDNEGPITLWDAASGQELRTLCSSSGYFFAFSPDWSILATVNRLKTIKLWDVTSGEELRTLSGHTDDIYGITFSRDGSRLASWSADMVIKIWEVATGNEQSTLSVGEYISNVSFLPDGETLVYLANGKPITLWDIASNQVLGTIGAVQQGEGISLSPDGEMVLFSGRLGNVIKLYDLASGKELRKLDWQSYSVAGLAYSPDGRMVAVGLQSGEIKLLDAANGRELSNLTGHLYGVPRLAFSPDGAALASGSFDLSDKLWEVASGKELQSMPGADISWFGGMTSVVFSPDGKTLAYGAPRGQVKLFDIANNKELRTLGGTPEGGIIDDVNSVAYSPDGKILVSGYGMGSITLWDATSGEQLRTLTGQQSVTALAFSPDGSILASVSNNLMIRIWDVTSWSELRAFTVPGMSGSSGMIYTGSLAFSPNGKVLAVGSDVGPFVLWDAISGNELFTLAGSAGNLAFSPDGKVMITGSANGTILVWGIAPANTAQPEVMIELPGEELSPTQAPSSTAIPEEVNMEKLPIPVLVTGNNLQGGNWSLDGSYFYYTDLGPLGEPAPNQAIKSLSFLDARTGEICPSIQETVTFTQDEWHFYPEGIDLNERILWWIEDNRLLYLDPFGELMALRPCSDSTENWSASLPDSIPSFRYGPAAGSQILLKGELAYWLFTTSTRQSVKLDIPAPEEGKEISLDWSPWEPKLISSWIEERQGEYWVVLAYIDAVTGSASPITEFQASPELQNSYPMYVGVGWLSKDQILVGDISSWSRLYDLSSQPIQFTNLFPDLFGMEFPGMGPIMSSNTIRGTGGRDYHFTFTTGFDMDAQYYIYHAENGAVDQYPLDPSLLVIFPTGQGDIVSSYMGSQPSNNTYRVIFVDSDTQPYDLVAKGHTPGQNSWSSATILPGGQRVMFSSIQGISLVDLQSGEILKFWGLENQEQYADFYAWLSPDGMSVVGFASAQAPGQGYQNQAMYWLRLEP
jgi:WD40 repeat protein